jgi:hypothetical protein
VAATTTTIKGVQILTKKRARRADVFDIALSVEGIQVLRPGRTAQNMGWDRVSQWEIEERSGYVLLTLRGDGAVTPLVVRGWTLDDLEVVMRDVTAGSPRAEPVPDAMAVAAADATEDGMTNSTERAGTESGLTVRPERVVPAQTRAERVAAGRRAGRIRVGWRAVVTVTLLCFLAAAVALVLLQSAGIINWGILGPTA